MSEVGFSKKYVRTFLLPHQNPKTFKYLVYRVRWLDLEEFKLKFIIIILSIELGSRAYNLR